LCFDAEMLWSYHHHRFKRSSNTRIQPLFHPCLLRIIATAAYALPPPPPPPPNSKARLTSCVTYILGVCLTLAWRGVTVVGTASTVMVVSTRRYCVTTILIRSIVPVYLHHYNIRTVFFNKGEIMLFFSFIVHYIPLSMHSWKINRFRRSLRPSTRFAWFRRGRTTKKAVNGSYSATIHIPKYIIFLEWTRASETTLTRTLRNINTYDNAIIALIASI